MNEKFNKNAKVEQLTKVVLCHGEEEGLIVKDPYWYQQSFFVWCLLRQRNGEWNSGQKPATIVTDAFLLWNGTQSNNTCSYILLDHSNAFGLSRRFFFVANKLTNAYLMWGRGGGVEFSTMPPSGAPWILTGPNWHMHNLAMGPTI